MGVVVCVWMRDKGQVVGSKVVVASTQATVVAAVEQVTQKKDSGPAVLLCDAQRRGYQKLHTLSNGALQFF